MPDTGKLKPDNHTVVEAIRHLRYLFQQFGHRSLGESCSQLEHARQCAALAQAEGAAPSLVCAAFLHDIGHLQACHLALPGTDDEGHRDHDRIGAQLLRQLGFAASVFVPVARHVEAKRYLAACDTDYLQRLSPASKRSLEIQGAAMSTAEQRRFLEASHAQDAIALRTWDEAGKRDNQAIPDLDQWLSLCERLLTTSAARASIPRHEITHSLKTEG
ncbi:HD domain-containing protein [Microbulbifer pacificus]|uniref:HD domain-containing protein n=1 Tax=Microbulbifer pacificus TaxID=407164 RepID=UPI001319EA2A|nr:HD domain-containing protein [Microbulbifer pacificus]